MKEHYSLTSTLPTGQTASHQRDHKGIRAGSILLFLFTMLCVNAAMGFNENEIAVDVKSKSLIAPYASLYQWYYGGQAVKEGTAQKLAVDKSGLYTVEMTGMDGSVSIKNILIEVTAATIRKIYIIGDSTVMTYKSSAYPQTGWGQILPFFLNNTNIAIDNHAIGGRSSRSFYQEGRWTPIVSSLLPGDFVFIQFGHNDRDFAHADRYTDTTDYKKYLTIYVNDTRSKGAFPVLVTPMIMNAWNGTTLRNVFTEGANNYRGAMVHVANTLHVPLIDLNMKSFNLMKSLGKDYITNFLYLTLQPGEYPNFPTGNSDGTHFQEMGAIEITKLIAQGISELSKDANVGFLAQNLRPTVQVSTSTNNSAAGLITRTNTYPQGVTVTIKGFPATGHSLVQWNDGANNVVATTPKFSFTMGTTSQSYKGYFDQVGSTNLTIQENTTGFCSVQGTIDNNNTGFTGSGFTNANNAIGAGVTWSANTGSGSTTISWRYANGAGADRPGKLLINGSTVVSSISFPATTNWTTWSTVSVNVNLSSGVKTIRLESTTATGLANIDQITVSGVNPQAVSCTGVARMDVSSTQSDALKEIETSSASIYPNPSENTFNLKSEEACHYVIYDHLGKELESGKAQDVTPIGLGLTPGHYIVRVKTKNNTQKIRIIKH